jgi:hypothetical protein
MSLFSRPMKHTQTTFRPGVIERPPALYFAPPAPAHMREPGTNYVTILTAEGPVTGRVEYRQAY